MISLNLSPFLLTVLWASSLILMSQAQLGQLGEWQQINYRATNVITGRYSHAGAYMSSTNAYLVFSGFRSGALSDFHSINLASLESTQLAASTPLGGRSGLAYTSDLASNFYIHGGWTGSGMLITFKLSSFSITTYLISVLQ
jgi:hypothetical protein